MSASGQKRTFGWSNGWKVDVPDFVASRFGKVPPMRCLISLFAASLVGGSAGAGQLDLQCLPLLRVR